MVTETFEEILSKSLVPPYLAFLEAMKACLEIKDKTRLFKYYEVMKKLGLNIELDVLEILKKANIKHVN